MSANEVINEVQELPVAEQERVLDFLEKKLRRKSADNVKYAADADFEKAADKIFRENDNLFRRLAQ